MKKISFILMFFFITTTASQIDAPMYDTMEEMRTTIIKLTDKITDLHIEVKTLKEESKKKDVELDRLKEEQIERKIINTIIMYYKNAGTFQKWYWITPELINNVIKYIKRWKHLAEPIPKVSQYFDFELFALAWSINECNLDPNAKRTSNENGKIDHGIMQINECNLFILNGLPAGLKKDIMNVETNIAVWMIWFKYRVRDGMPYLTLDEARGWKPYRLARKAKYE